LKSNSNQDYADADFKTCFTKTTVLTEMTFYCNVMAYGDSTGARYSMTLDHEVESSIITTGLNSHGQVKTVTFENVIVCFKSLLSCFFKKKKKKKRVLCW